MKNLNLHERISIPDAINLQHNAALNDIKVTFKIVNGFTLIYIRDLEISTYAQALKVISQINEAERPGDSPAEIALSNAI